MRLNFLFSGFRDHASRTRRVLLPMAALLLIPSVESSFAQIDPAQFINRSSSGPQTISRNQLLAPGKAWHAIERAQKELVAGHPDMAQREIARALGFAPHFGVAKVMQGAIDLETGNEERARTLFQQAIDDDPVLGGAYAGMAVVLIRQGRFQAALPLLDRAEGLLPGAWFVQFAKGWAELELGDAELPSSRQTLPSELLDGLRKEIWRVLLASNGVAPSGRYECCKRTPGRGRRTRSRLRICSPCKERA